MEYVIHRTIRLGIFIQQTANSPVVTQRIVRSDFVSDKDWETGPGYTTNPMHARVLSFIQAQRLLRQLNRSPLKGLTTELQLLPTSEVAFVEQANGIGKN